MEKIQCPKCRLRAVKNGFQSGKQRYKCTSCKKKFHLKYTYEAYNEHTNSFIISLLKEGCGVRSISRILKISKNTVLSRMLKIAKEIKIPYFNKLGCQFEVDEMFIKLANGKTQNWLIYAIEQKTRTVISFIIGSRNTENLKMLVDKLLLLHPKRIYTDRLNIYPNLIPKAIHKRFQSCTNKIERMNLTLRTHIKRLSRRTICFSRDRKYLEAHLRIYFWG